MPDLDAGQLLSILSPPFKIWLAAGGDDSKQAITPHPAVCTPTSVPVKFAAQEIPEILIRNL